METGFIVYGYTPNKLAQARLVPIATEREAERWAVKRWPRAKRTGAVSEWSELPAGFADTQKQVEADKLTPPADPLRELIHARWVACGSPAFEDLSRRCGGKPDPESISRYLRGRISLNSRYASALLEVLGWDGSVGWVDTPHAVVGTP